MHMVAACRDFATRLLDFILDVTAIEIAIFSVRASAPEAALEVRGVRTDRENEVQKLNEADSHIVKAEGTIQGRSLS